MSESDADEQNLWQQFYTGELSDEEIEALHYRLDALLNARKRMAKLAIDEASMSVIHENRLDLNRQASKFISDVCGDSFKFGETEFDNPIERISATLALWRRAFELHDKFDYFWEDVVGEIHRLKFGDEPEILVPAKRPPGSHKQRAKIASRRMTALQWSEFLKAREVPAGVVHRLVSLAYGTDWDAIRKWRLAAEKLFSPEYVADTLEYAQRGIGLRLTFPNFSRELHGYGAQYRALAGIAQLPLESFEKAVEAENLSG